MNTYLFLIYLYNEVKELLHEKMCNLNSLLVQVTTCDYRHLHLQEHQHSFCDTENQTKNQRLIKSV